MAEHEKPLSLIDLGAWVGQEFSAESKIELDVATRVSLLIDKDDEFLGCSKIGDSGAQSSASYINLDYTNTLTNYHHSYRIIK